MMTVRLPSSLRRQVEELARREGRSLSRQVGRLIEEGIGRTAGGPAGVPLRRARELSGLLQGGRVPVLADFREVRALISTSFRRRGETDAKLRR